MKLISSETGKIVIELTSKEFDVISQVLTAAREDYDSIDPAMLNTSFEDIASVDESFMDLLSELNERRGI